MGFFEKSGTDTTSSSPRDKDTHSEEEGVSTSVHQVEAEIANPSGHRDQLKRQYGLLAICGAALSIDNAWIAFAGSLQVAIANGGPPGVLYELLTACFYYFFINASIAELASSIPSSGGVYHWASVTPGVRYGRAIGWFAGCLNFFGWIFDLASIAYIPANVAVEMYLIFHPDLALQAWMQYVTFAIIVVLATTIVIFANFILPPLQHVGMFLVIVGGLVTIICVAALADPHASSGFVWGDFINSTGWPNGVAFLTGVLNGAFTIGTPDAITHIAEEMPRPSRDLPKAVFVQLILGTITSFCFGIAIFYGITDLDAVVNSTGSFALGTIYLQNTGSKGGALGLLMIVLLSILVCTVGTVLTCSRILWTLARDDVVPFPRFFSRVNERLSCPIPATLMTMVLTLGFGAIQLGSKTAFNDLVGSFIILTSTSYLLAILPHLLTGRKNIPHGDFWMGRVGYIVNALACLFIVLFNVFFCFPYSYPVSDASLMNYNSVILVGCVVLSAFWWLVYGMRRYKGPKLPHLDTAGHIMSEEK